MRRFYAFRGTRPAAGRGRRGARPAATLDIAAAPGSLAGIGQAPLQRGAAQQQGGDGVTAGGGRSLWAAPAHAGAAPSATAPRSPKSTTSRPATMMSAPPAMVQAVGRWPSSSSAYSGALTGSR